MSAYLLVVVAVVTVGSRILALAVLPQPSGRAADIIERLPAPLFASLAVLTATDVAQRADGTPLGVLVASGFALAVAGRRSLSTTLIAGLAGYVLVELAQL